MTTEQMKLLNLLLPFGFCLAPKGKSYAQQSRVRDSYASTAAIRKDKKSDNKSDYFEPAKQIVPPQPSRILDPQMLKCMRILTKLRRHQNAYPFSEPVDPRQVPNYLSIIKEPMDLSTVEANIQAGVLTSIQQFVSDVRKIWQNAYIFNAKGSTIYDMAASVERYFNRLLAEEGVPVPGSSVAYAPQQPAYERLMIEKPVIHRTEPAIKKKNVVASSLSETPMTMQEKRSLGQMIKKLPHEYLRGVWEIVNDNQENREELEFDIETLPVKKARHLESYVKSIFSTLESKKLKEVTNQMDQASENESSFIIDSDGSD